MKKLVVIDDDPIDHFVMKHALRGTSYFDTTTYTIYGSLVLDYIEENKAKPEKLPDVILLDLNMPRFSGWEFLERLQEMSSGIRKNIKVHVLSSSLRPADKENAEKYPFVRSYMSKPLSPQMVEKLTQKQYAE
jgi:CheY-like chemotaxis protein